jgi:amino acid transporter
MASSEGGVTLGKGNLSLLDVVAQAVGFIGPVFASAFFIPTIAGLSFSGHGAGVATPISIILAGIGMIAVGWIISRFAKRIHAAGSLYDYVTDGFGRQVGFVAGWIYYGGMACLTLAIGLAFGGFLSFTLSINGHGEVKWWIPAVGFWIVAFLMQFFGVQISTRAQLGAALVSMAVIFGFAIYVIAKGGTAGNSADAFNPGATGTNWTGIFYGILYAVIMYIGFETAANLAEETSDPKRQIPRAILLSVVVSAVFYVVVAYALLAAFGFDMAKFLDLANFPPLYSGAAIMGDSGGNFAQLVQWLVVLDIAAVGLGTATGTSRGIFALARDGFLPKQFAYIHPRYRTPAVASAFLAIASIVVVIVVYLTDGLVQAAQGDLGTWFGFFQWGATIGGFMLVFVYLLISLTGFLGQPGENRALLAVAGVVGVAVTVAALYGVLKGAPAFWALNKVWWEALLWGLLGVGLAVLFTSQGKLKPHDTTPIGS